jgi:hypothetical protein
MRCDIGELFHGRVVLLTSPAESWMKRVAILQQGPLVRPGFSPISGHGLFPRKPGNDTERSHMSNDRALDPLIIEAISKIEAFIVQTTGSAPTPDEISGALTRYFVLKEIKDFIVMSRGESGEGETAD